MVIVLLYACVCLCVSVCVCEIVMDIATYIYRMRVCYNFKHLTFVLVQQAKRATLHVCPARGLAWLLIICKQQHCCCCRCHDCDCCCCCRVECLLLSELPMRAICILINVAATCNKWKWNLKLKIIYVFHLLTTFYVFTIIYHYWSSFRVRKFKVGYSCRYFDLGKLSVPLLNSLLSSHCSYNAVRLALTLPNLESFQVISDRWSVIWLATRHRARQISLSNALLIDVDSARTDWTARLDTRAGPGLDHIWQAHISNKISNWRLLSNNNNNKSI